MKRLSVGRVKLNLNSQASTHDPTKDDKYDLLKEYGIRKDNVDSMRTNSLVNDPSPLFLEVGVFAEGELRDGREVDFGDGYKPLKIGSELIRNAARKWKNKPMFYGHKGWIDSDSERFPVGKLFSVLSRDNNSRATGMCYINNVHGATVRNEVGVSNSFGMMEQGVSVAMEIYENGFVSHDDCYEIIDAELESLDWVGADNGAAQGSDVENVISFSMSKEYAAKLGKDDYSKASKEIEELREELQKVNRKVEPLHQEAQSEEAIQQKFETIFKANSDRTLRGYKGKADKIDAFLGDSDTRSNSLEQVLDSISENSKNIKAIKEFNKNCKILFGEDGKSGIFSGIDPDEFNLSKTIEKLKSADKKAKEASEAKLEELDKKTDKKLQELREETSGENEKLSTSISQIETDTKDQLEKLDKSTDKKLQVLREETSGENEKLSTSISQIESNTESSIQTLQSEIKTTSETLKEEFSKSHEELENKLQDSEEGLSKTINEKAQLISEASDAKAEKISKKLEAIKTDSNNSAEQMRTSFAEYKEEFKKHSKEVESTITTKSEELSKKHEELEKRIDAIKVDADIVKPIAVECLSAYIASEDFQKTMIEPTMQDKIDASLSNVLMSEKTTKAFDKKFLSFVDEKTEKFVFSTEQLSNILLSMKDTIKDVGAAALMKNPNFVEVYAEAFKVFISERADKLLLDNADSKEVFTQVAKKVTVQILSDDKHLENLSGLVVEKVKEYQLAKDLKKKELIGKLVIEMRKQPGSEKWTDEELREKAIGYATLLTLNGEIDDSETADVSKAATVLYTMTSHDSSTLKAITGEGKKKISGQGYSPN